VAVALSHIAFLTAGSFAADTPSTGLEATLRLFAHAEAIGYDGGWVRSRHLERGIASAAVFLAAVSQRTQRIELGTAVIQLGYELPFRLAEDLATADSLSHGRLQVGVSSGKPAHHQWLGEALFEQPIEAFDFSHARVLRLRDHLTSPLLGDEDARIITPAGAQRPRLHPISPTLPDRLWYGGGSNRSMVWTAENGFNLLIGNVNQAEDEEGFLNVQLGHLALFREHWSRERPPRIALGRVILPTDTASPETAARYHAFAAGRLERTRAPNGERRTQFAEDVVGSSTEILAALANDPVLPLVNELRIELPYDFAEEDHSQILDDFRTHIAPALGWRPSTTA
jgi:alkanesulfonate monooxygenase SsuD/methylene tetrahydromethanopterin reductase-like flavin-dependent oxidoreductase (luciferase family)